MKNITGVYTAPRQHWVGDGFPVRSMFSYQTHGEPLNEPIVGYGPFVMNSKTEINEAIRDFNSGRFGQL